MRGFRLVSAFVVFLGAGMEMSLFVGSFRCTDGRDGTDQYSGDPDFVRDGI